MGKENSPIIIVIVVFVVAVAIGGFYFLSNSSRQGGGTSLPTIAPVTEKEVGMEKELMAKEAGARYVEYTKEGYENIRNQKHVLFFYANWCPTCRPVDAEFQARMDDIPEDIVIVRVNYNDSEADADEDALANEHNITYQHTFVLLENGQEVTRWNGGGLSNLLANLK